MKKFVIILSMVLFAVVAMAQERTNTTSMKPDVSFVEWQIGSSDILIEGTRDTIDFILNNQNHQAVEKIVLSMSIDSVAGADSIFYSLYGFNDLANTGTSIVSGGILVDQMNEIIEVSKWYWTNATTYVDLNYRYYRFRVIQASNNSYDGGADFDYIKAKLHLK